MAASAHRRFLLLLLPLVLFLLPFPLSSSSAPTPAPWPPQFHASLYVNYSGELSTIELWYDWPNGRNLNLIRSQLAPDGDVLHDVEWNNGTSFIYTLGASGSCRTLLVGVGILRPNWLEGANYLGTEKVDSFLCHVWEKEQFIWYYEDVVSRRPVHWLFYTGRSIHVMNYELGAVLEDAKWQAPAYCFNRNDNVDNVEELSELRTISNAPLVEFSSLKKPENVLAA